MRRLGEQPIRSGVRREIRPTFTVPLLIIGLIVLFCTLFGAVFGILPFVMEDPSAVLRVVSLTGAAVILLSWLGFFRAWTTRRRFANYHLVLESGSVSPGTPCRFVVEDRGGGLNVATNPRFFLSYQELSQRRGGRKVYSEGPFVLDVKISSEFSAGGTHPAVSGEFVVKAGQIKTATPDNEWVIQTQVLLTMQLPGRRRCKFELPYAPDLGAIES